MIPDQYSQNLLREGETLTGSDMSLQGTDDVAQAGWVPLLILTAEEGAGEKRAHGDARPHLEGSTAFQGFHAGDQALVLHLIHGT